MKCTPLVAVMLMVATATAVADSNPAATTVIRTYNYAQVPPDQLTQARAAADAIFGNAGVSLQWIECRVPILGAQWTPGAGHGSSWSEGAACATPPPDDTRSLMLRLMDRKSEDTAASKRVVGLGVSMLDREQRGGVLMTVDVFSVRAVAEQASADLPTLLGRAIAHEIGHLLLGTAAHPSTGLMRAFWSQDELRGLRPANWRFSSQEAAQMRHGLAAKGRGAT